MKVEARNNPLRMGFYCVLTLSPDVPYLFYLKLVKNAKIGDFWGKFTSKSGDALKSSNFNDILCQIVTSFFVVLSKKIQSSQMTQIKNCQNHRKLCKNANIW